MEIRMPHNISEHWLWSDPVKFQWWILLLQKVAEETCVVNYNGNEKTCERGQLLTTQGELAKLWGTTPDTCQGFLRKLERRGEIRRKADAKLTEITICKLEDWESPSRKADAKLTDRRNPDGILTEITNDDSVNYPDDRRNPDGILTEKETEKRKEKESFPHTPFKEKENKKEKEESTTDVVLCSPAHAEELEGGINFRKLVIFFNEQMADKMIPKVKAILGKRRQSVLARSKEYGKEEIMTAILNAANSSFLNGNNQRGFVATFDWIFGPKNFPKVLENNFADRTNQTEPSNGRTNRNFPTSAEARQQRKSDFAAHIYSKLAGGQKPGGSESD